MSDKPTYDRREAAAYITARGLPTPYKTLHKFALRRRAKERGDDEKGKGEIGPPYVIYGVRAVYKKADLDAWIEAKLNPPAAKPSRPKNRRLQRRAA